MAPFAALLVVALLMACALAVDIGMQRVARADMQALADVISLDLARELDGRTRDQLQPVVDDLAAKSLARNLDAMGDAPDLEVELGRLHSNGTFVSIGGSEKATALRVTAATSVAFAFAGVTDVDGGDAARQASAMATTAACYKLGSWAGAAAGTGDWVLVTPWLRLLAGQSGAFSDAGAVRSLTYHPLAAASVNLAALATSLGKESVTALATSTVALKPLMTALRAVAAPLSSANTTTMTSLVTLASTTRTVDLTKVVAVDATLGISADSTVNLLDVVGGAISQVDTTAVAELGFGTAISGMSNGFLLSGMTDGPRQYCGYGGATRLSSSTMTPKGQYSAGGLISSPLTVSTFGLTATSIFTGAASSYTKSVQAYGYVIADALKVGASASQLMSVDCDGKRASVQVTRGAATVGVKAKVYGTVQGTVRIGGRTYTNATVSISKVNPSTGYDTVTGDAGQVPVTLAPASTVTPSVVQGASPVPAGPTVVTTGAVTYPHGAPPVTITYTSGGRQVTLSPTEAEKKLIFESVYDAAMAQMVDPTRSGNLLTRYVEPLIALAGVSVGGVEVALDSVPALICAQPRLVG